MKRFALLVVAACTLVLSACGGGGGTGSSGGSGPDGSGAATSSAGADGDAAEWGRVVALGEEFLLADVLALGITPVASTATVSDAGFQGLDTYDTAEIEAYPGTEANFEALAAQRPDTIVTTEFIVDEVGLDVLEGIAEDVIVVPLSGGEQQLEDLAEALDREDEAQAVLADLDAARDAAVAAAPADCEVSLGTVYGGPTPAAWVAAPSSAAIVLEELGCTLSPSSADGDVDHAGRIYLSLENVGLFGAEDLILLQSDAVGGEAESLAELSEDGVWQQLPAVEAGNVHILDRLGYPGVEGQARLYEDLGAIVAADG